MINYKPALALSIVLLGFLLSISVAFLDILGPKIPLTRKSISTILTKPNKSFSLIDKENTDTITTKKSAELYLNQSNQIYGYSNLNFNSTLSDPKNGNFTFLSALCFGNSKNDCTYRSAYLKSTDNGNTWKIGFLD